MHLSKQALAAMAAFYSRVDAVLAAFGPACGACGRCCRFDTADHILYASSLERAYLVTVSPPPPFDEQGELFHLLSIGHRCPYQDGDACLARDGRTLGCRTHFCEWRDPDGAAEASELLHRELKMVHERLGLEWDYRPLLPL